MPKLMLVEAFTSETFRGNPAGVVLLDGPADERWMQSVAADMNQSETAFIIAAGDVFGLRWFTPTVEMDLCGHATLASAHALWEAGVAPTGEPIRFHTRSGLLTCTQDADAIAMDFPADPLEPVDLPDAVLDALGIDEAPGSWRGNIGYVIELDHPDEVKAVAPDFTALAKVDPKGVVVCAQGGPEGADFISRFFAPAQGIDEDPVTGAAHCALGPLWALRLGKDDVLGFQASKRGGWVRVKVAGDRVTLIGSAITVATGDLLA